MFRKSAYEVFVEEKKAGFIITLCKDLDEALGGGIRIGSTTEIVGNPGVGKTQFWYVKVYTICKSVAIY